MKNNRLLGSIGILVIIVLILILIIVFLSVAINNGVDQGLEIINDNLPTLDSAIAIGEEVADVVETYVPAINQITHEYYQKVCIPSFVTGDQPPDYPSCFIPQFGIPRVDGCPVGCADARAIMQTCELEQMADNSLCQLIRQNGLLGGNISCG